MDITLNGFSTPGNTVSGVLYVMHNDTHLFVALVVDDSTQNTGSDRDYAMIDFDQGHDHVATANGEDAMDIGYYSTTYQDCHWGTDPWTYTWWVYDTYWGGTQHGSGAQSYSSGQYIYEFSKPLNSGEAMDIALAVGDIVGFRIETWDNGSQDNYRYPQNTVDANTARWNEWADLTIAQSQCNLPHPNANTLPWLNDTQGTVNISIKNIGCNITQCSDAGNATEILVEIIDQGEHCGEEFWIWYDSGHDFFGGNLTNGSCYEAEIFGYLYEEQCGYVARYLFQEINCTQCNETTTTTTSTTSSTTSSSTTTTTSTTTTSILVIAVNQTINTTANTTANVSGGATNVSLQMQTSQDVSGGQIEFRQQNSNPTGSNFGLTDLGRYVNITPNSAVENSLSWVIVNMYYTAAEIAERNVNESTLWVYWYNESSSSWVALNESGRSGRNTTADPRYVWANTTHFSVYTAGGVSLSESGSYTLSSGWNLISIPMVL